MQLPAQLLCDINGPRHILPSQSVSLFALVLGMRYCHARVLLTSSAMSNTSCHDMADQRPTLLRASRKLNMDMPTHWAIVMPQPCNTYNTAVPSKHTTTSYSGKAARSSAESNPAGMNSIELQAENTACCCLPNPALPPPASGRTGSQYVQELQQLDTNTVNLKEPAYQHHAPASCAPSSWTSAQDIPQFVMSSLSTRPAGESCMRQWHARCCLPHKMGTGQVRGQYATATQSRRLGAQLSDVSQLEAGQYTSW